MGSKDERPRQSDPMPQRVCLIPKSKNRKTKGKDQKKMIYVCSNCLVKLTEWISFTMNGEIVCEECLEEKIEEE
jgi:DNA-directed RNA polymerase subunit RPC12/RpoP